MKEEKDQESREGEEHAAEEAISELPEEEIARLKDALEAKEREAKENYNKFLRAVADLENYKKRSEKEKAEAISFANETLLEEILPVMDNFARALEHANGMTDLDSLTHGVKLTVDQMYAVFKKFGLEEIKSVGEKFDPALHHAISEEESAEIEPGSVVKEYQKGYLLKGRLLRPSMVAVAKKPEVH